MENLIILSFLVLAGVVYLVRCFIKKPKEQRVPDALALGLIGILCGLMWIGGQNQAEARHDTEGKGAANMTVR